MTTPHTQQAETDGNVGTTALPNACFVTTHWSVVLTAGDPTSPHAATALESLCRAYWYPLYAFVRRRGHSPPDAQDFTQEFFARLLEHNWIAHADRHKGRFRSFLLMAMKRFLSKKGNRVASKYSTFTMLSDPRWLKSSERMTLDYDRGGRLRSVTDGSGTRALAWNERDQSLSESF